MTTPKEEDAFSATFMAARAKRDVSYSAWLAVRASFDADHPDLIADLDTYAVALDADPAMRVAQTIFEADTLYADTLDATASSAAYMVSNAYLDAATATFDADHSDLAAARIAAFDAQDADLATRAANVQ